MIKLLSIISLILAIVLFPPATLAVISNNAVPGDATYPIKRSLEDIIFAVASVNPVTKAWFSAARSDRRFTEFKTLVAQGKKGTDTLNELVEQTNIAATQIAQVTNPTERVKLIEQLSASIDKYDQSLKQITDSSAVTVLPQTTISPSTRFTIQPTARPTIQPTPIQSGPTVQSTPVPTTTTRRTPTPTAIAQATPVPTSPAQLNPTPTPSRSEDTEIQKEIEEARKRFEEIKKKLKEERQKLPNHPSSVQEMKQESKVESSDKKEDKQDKKEDKGGRNGKGKNN